jgi:hypothetical protein
VSPYALLYANGWKLSSPSSCPSGCSLLDSHQNMLTLWARKHLKGASHYELSLWPARLLVYSYLFSFYTKPPKKFLWLSAFAFRWTVCLTKPSLTWTRIICSPLPFTIYIQSITWQRWRDAVAKWKNKSISSRLIKISLLYIWLIFSKISLQANFQNSIDHRVDFITCRLQSRHRLLLPLTEHPRK